MRVVKRELQLALKKLVLWTVDLKVDLMVVELVELMVDKKVEWKELTRVDRLVDCLADMMVVE